MKTVAAVIFLFIFTACSTTYPAITQYRIAVDAYNSDTLQSLCKKSSLKVSQAFVKSSLMSKKMKYVVGEYQEGAFNQSEWAEDPNKAITDVIVQSLQNAGIFDTVTSYKSFSSSDYTLESSVADFTQHFTADEKSSVAKIDISFVLVDNATAQVVATKHIVKELPTKDANAKSGVEALNTLLQESLREMQAWLAKSCR